MMVLITTKMGCIVFDMNVMPLHWLKFVDVTPIDILAYHIMCPRGGYIVWVVLLAFCLIPWRRPLPNRWRYWVGPFIPEFGILSLKINLLYISSYNICYYKL